MTSDIVLRQGWRPGDLGAVVRLHGQVYAEHGLDQRFEAFVARELGALATGESAGNLWLAETGDDAVVGSVALRRGGVRVVPRASRHVIELCEEERRELERRAATVTLPFRVVQRARMILYAAEGMQDIEIAARPRPRPAKITDRDHATLALAA